MVLSMSANSGLPEDDLVERAVAWLCERLPASWEVGRTSRVELREPSGGRAEVALDLRGPSGAYVTIAVEAKRAFGPRDVDRLQGSLGRVFRTLAGNVPILVVSPWLSPADPGVATQGGDQLPGPHRECPPETGQPDGDHRDPGGLQRPLSGTPFQGSDPGSQGGAARSDAGRRVSAVWRSRSCGSCGPQPGVRVPPP